MGTGLGEQLNLLQTKWPQSHVKSREIDQEQGEFLIIVPSVLLPKGYNKTICTVLFLASWYGGETIQTPLDNFWVDIPDLALADGQAPYRSWRCGGPCDGRTVPCFGHRGGIWDGIPGFPEWKELRLFLWHAQEWDPNRDTLTTSMNLVRQRLRLVR